MSKKVEVLMTTNYDIFKFHEKNRGIGEGRIQNLAKSIKELDMTDCKPVVVNEKMEIIDGQGRFATCKELNLPIYYIKKNLNGESGKAMILLNANQANWPIDEYVAYYVKCGVQPYKDVIACKEKYGVSTSVAISFVSNQDHGASDTVKQGKMKNGKIPYSIYGEVLMDFKKIFKDYNHIFFIRALIYCINNKMYTHKTDFPRFEKNRHNLIGCANMTQYLHMFEDIMNRFRRGTRVDVVSSYEKKRIKQLAIEKQ
jgi:hypothetical protein